VDSSVAAALLLGQGYQISGVMLKLWSEPGACEGRENLCCTAEAEERARELALQLDFPFYVVDGRERFRHKVVEIFIAEYAAARTPNPCIPCNRDVRFPLLLEWAREYGADLLATGHYARVRQMGTYQLLRGVDDDKDQSYVLHALSQAHLAHTVFPLGKLAKEDVRAIARNRNLPAAEQPESQDICFLADGDYRRFLTERAPETVHPGPIVDREGNVLGEHSGLTNYTIGQRKGIGVAAPEPLYVLTLDAPNNALVVGPADELGRRVCMVERMHYISGEAPTAPFSATAKIRYRHRDVEVNVIPLGEGRVEVRFAEAQRDITPGQYLVVYDGEVVLGGGVISRAFSASEGVS
jgi:tRNA-specific 2-thiouridylase